MAAPTDYHWLAVKHLLRYLNGTCTYGIHMTKCSSLELVAFSDVGWVGNCDDRCITSFFCIFLGNNLVS